MSNLSDQEKTFIARVAYETDAAHQRIARGVNVRAYDELDPHSLDVLRDVVGSYAELTPNAVLSVFETAIVSALRARQAFVVELVTQKLEEVLPPAEPSNDQGEQAPSPAEPPKRARKASLPPVAGVLQNSSVAIEVTSELPAAEPVAPAEPAAPVPTEAA